MSEVDRVTAFSDTVFAITVPLLAPDVPVPSYEPGGLLGGLVREWPT
jgi:uncharacterized membrane protein